MSEKELSLKQLAIIEKVKILNPSLKVSSTTRTNSKPSSGHSPSKQLAVDFSGELKELYSMFITLQALKPTWTLGLGILNASKHLHVSDDDRGLKFLEIEKPDKDGFVKVITMGDRKYLDYLKIAQKEYGVLPNKIVSNEDSTKKKIINNISSFVARYVFIFLAFAKKIKK